MTLKNGTKSTFLAESMPPSAPRELYISVDVETSGPIPGDYSLLSIGACVVGEIERNFYVEVAPLNDHFTEEALTTSGLSMTQLRAHGASPASAMAQLASWLESLDSASNPIFVGFNAPFDWSFVNYYFIKFFGDNPFGHSALDIKSYYMGAYHTSWKGTSMKRLPDEIHPASQPLAHNALEDSKQQADIFSRLLENKPDRV